MKNIVKNILRKDIDSKTYIRVCLYSKQRELELIDKLIFVYIREVYYFFR